MKKLINKIAFFGLLLTGIVGNAQNEPSLLWQIEGNGLEKPSYLFGTIHMICEEDYIMTPAIEHSLKNTEAFYAEIDFSNQEEMMMMQAAMSVDEPLSKRLDSKTYEEFKNLLSGPLNIEIDALENLSDAAIVSMIAMKSFPCETLKMYELEILREFKEKGFESTQRLVALYKEQQIDDLLHLMRESSYMNEETYREMLTKRNHEWVEKIPEIMEQHATFFAVGAGHLGGDQGVLQLLRTRGYEVLPVNLN